MTNYFDESVKTGKIVLIDIVIRRIDTYLGKGCVIDDVVKIKYVGESEDIVLEIPKNMPVTRVIQQRKSKIDD